MKKILGFLVLLGLSLSSYAQIQGDKLIIPGGSTVPASISAIKATADSAKALAAAASGAVTIERLPVGVTVEYLNTAAIKAVRPATGTVARTHFFSTMGDGGAARFRYDAASTATVDDASVLMPSTGGTGAGRWLMIVEHHTVYAKQFGVKWDNIVDDTVPLQKAVNFIVSGQHNGSVYPTTNGTDLVLPRGIGKITAMITAGTQTPTFDPYRERSFKIRGVGPSGDPVGQTNSADNEGTQIRLTGTGHQAVFNVQRGATRWMEFSDFSVVCDQLGGATYGFLFSDTRFSQPRLTNIHSYRANRAFGILKGSGLNGEFVTFEKCVGDAVQNFFFMESSTGQAFGQYFNHCAGHVGDGGSIFEIGGGVLGFGLTAIEFESSALENAAQVVNLFDSMVGVTFFKNNGISGYANFIGGRQEHITTIIENVNTSYNNHASITFQGMEFDGMTCTSAASRSAYKSTGFNGAYHVTFESCRFAHFGAKYDQSYFGPSFVTGDATMWRFRNSSFYFRTMASRNTLNSRTNFENCSEKNQAGFPVAFSNMSDVGQGNSEQRVNAGNAHQMYGTPQNLLKQTLFTPGTNVVAPSPWAHTGNGNLPAVRDFTSTGIVGNANTDPDWRQLLLGGLSSVYQDIPSIDFSGSNVKGYYNAIVGIPDFGGRDIEITLENSTSGRIYKAWSSRTNDAPEKEIWVTLSAVDDGTPGTLRVRIRNLNGAQALLNIKKQWVSASPLSAYLPITTTTTAFGHEWDITAGLANFTGRLKLPAKADTYGSSATLSNLGIGETYYSTTTSNEKVYDGTRWNERPKQDIGTAAPTTGTYPVGFIRWNSAPTAGGNAGWICTATGSPSTFKTFGVIAN